MLPEDVGGITSSSLAAVGQGQRRKVKFDESDGESNSDSQGDESDYDEGEEQGEELQMSARTKQKSWTHKQQQSTKKGD